MDIQDVIELISTRDEISIEEAEELVKDCVEELDALFAFSGETDFGLAAAADDIVAEMLGLEPDYTPILLGC